MKTFESHMADKALNEGLVSNRTLRIATKEVAGRKQFKDMSKEDMKKIKQTVDDPKTAAKVAASVAQLVGGKVTRVGTDDFSVGFGNNSFITFKDANYGTWVGLTLFSKGSETIDDTWLKSLADLIMKAKAF
jgi:hypothetical protein